MKLGILTVAVVCSLSTIISNGQEAEVKKCDVHMWYLELLDQGVFDGELSEKQLKIKHNIDKLVERDMPMEISCDRLKMYRELLIQGLKTAPSPSNGDPKSEATERSSSIAVNEDLTSPEEDDSDTAVSATGARENIVQEGPSMDIDEREETLGSDGDLDEEDIVDVMYQDDDDDADPLKESPLHQEKSNREDVGEPDTLPDQRDWSPEGNKREPVVGVIYEESEVMEPGTEEQSAAGERDATNGHKEQSSKAKREDREQNVLETKYTQPDLQISDEEVDGHGLVVTDKGASDCDSKAFNDSMKLVIVDGDDQCPLATYGRHGVEWSEAHSAWDSSHETPGSGEEIHLNIITSDGDEGGEISTQNINIKDVLLATIGQISLPLTHNRNGEDASVASEIRETEVTMEHGDKVNISSHTKETSSLEIDRDRIRQNGPGQEVNLFRENVKVEGEGEKYSDSDDIDETEVDEGPFRVYEEVFAKQDDMVCNNDDSLGHSMHNAAYLFNDTGNGRELFSRRKLAIGDEPPVNKIMLNEEQSAREDSEDEPMTSAQHRTELPHGLKDVVPFKPWAHALFGTKPFRSLLHSSSPRRRQELHENTRTRSAVSSTNAFKPINPSESALLRSHTCTEFSQGRFYYNALNFMCGNEPNIGTGGYVRRASLVPQSHEPGSQKPAILSGLQLRNSTSLDNGGESANELLIANKSAEIDKTAISANREQSTNDTIPVQGQVQEKRTVHYAKIKENPSNEIEYLQKVHILEMQILRLENRFLSETVDGNKNVDQFNKLEIQILRLENEILRLNNTLVAQGNENDRLRMNQKSQANELSVFKAKATNTKYPLLADDSTMLSDVINDHKAKIHQLQTALHEQTNYFKKLEQRSKKLEDENQDLVDKLLNQSTTITQIMHTMETIAAEQVSQKNVLQDAIKTINESNTTTHQYKPEVLSAQTQQIVAATHNGMSIEEGARAEVSYSDTGNVEEALLALIEKELYQMPADTKLQAGNRMESSEDNGMKNSAVELKVTIDSKVTDDHVQTSRIQTQTGRGDEPIDDDNRDIAAGDTGDDKSKKDTSLNGNGKGNMSRTSIEESVMQAEDAALEDNLKEGEDATKLMENSADDLPAEAWISKLDNSISNDDSPLRDAEATGKLHKSSTSKLDQPPENGYRASEEGRKEGVDNAKPTTQLDQIAAASSEGTPSQEKVGQDVNAFAPGAGTVKRDTMDSAVREEAHPSVDPTHEENKNPRQVTRETLPEDVDGDPPKLLYTDHSYHGPKDCYDHYMSGRRRDTSMRIRPAANPAGFDAFCDMKNGGWTVIMRRQDGSVDFFRDWQDYKTGFGAVNNEHWLGNDAIHQMTNQDYYTLRIDMMNWEREKAYAEYDTFRIGSEKDGYQLYIHGYRGDAGDAMIKHSGNKFSTRDVDNDLAEKDFGGSCANRFSGAWWYYKCYKSNLTGRYYRGGKIPDKLFDGVTWKPWTGSKYSLKRVEMKIRPKRAKNN